MSRNFVIDCIYKGSSKKEVEAGHFTSSTPAGAAKKAFSSACKTLKIKGRSTLKVYVRETTQDSLKKIYGYKVSRSLIKNPEPRMIGGVEIINRWEIKAHSLHGK